MKAHGHRPSSTIVFHSGPRMTRASSFRAFGDGEFHEAGGRPDRRLAKGGVADAQHAELSWQAIQVQANAVEVGIGGAAGEGRTGCGKTRSACHSEEPQATRNLALS